MLLFCWVIFLNKDLFGSCLGSIYRLCCFMLFLLLKDLICWCLVNDHSIFFGGCKLFWALLTTGYRELLQTIRMNLAGMFLETKDAVLLVLANKQERLPFGDFDFGGWRCLVTGG